MTGFQHIAPFNHDLLVQELVNREITLRHGIRLSESPPIRCDSRVYIPMERIPSMLSPLRCILHIAKLAKLAHWGERHSQLLGQLRRGRKTA